MLSNWYFYKTQDGNIQGYFPAENEEEVEAHVGKPLKAKRVIWNGEEFKEVKG